MKYAVTFQKFDRNQNRPTGGPSDADFTTDDAGMIPVVGDYVQVSSTRNTIEAKPFAGRVKSRLFIYRVAGACSINIVIDDNVDSDGWALVNN